MKNGILGNFLAENKRSSIYHKIILHLIRQITSLGSLKISFSTYARLGYRTTWLVLSLEVSPNISSEHKLYRRDYDDLDNSSILSTLNHPYLPIELVYAQNIK